MDLSERGLTAGKVNKIYTLLFKQSGFAITYFLAGMFYNSFIIYSICCIYDGVFHCILFPTFIIISLIISS